MNFLHAIRGDGDGDLILLEQLLRGIGSIGGFDFHEIRGLCGRFPEILAINRRDIVPWLGSKGIMDDATSLLGDFPWVDALHVPAAREIVDLVFADDVEIILILGDGEIVEGDQIDELLENIDLSPHPAVDDDHACVEITVAVDAEDFLSIKAAFIDGGHNGFRDGADVFVANVDIVKLGDVFDDGGIAIDVDCFVELREFACDDKAEIGRCGIIIAKRQFGDDRTNVVVDIVEDDLDVPFGHRGDLCLVLGGNIIMQNVNFVAA